MIMGSDNVNQHQTGKNKLLSPTKPEKTSCYLLPNRKKTSYYLLITTKVQIAFWCFTLKVQVPF